MDWTKDAKSHFKKMAGLTTLARQAAVESLMNHEAESQKNQQAEGAFVRRTLWGAKDEEQAEESDQMRQTIVGDVTNPTPVVIAPQQQSNTLGTIAAIVAAMATGGILGSQYLGKQALELVQPQQQPQQQAAYEDSTIRIGLGRLENYESLKP